MNYSRQISLVVTVFFIALTLSGCGSSGSSGTSSSGNPGSSSSDFIVLDELEILPPNLSDNESMTVDWTTGFHSPSSIYTFELHLTDDPTITSSLTKVFGLNCGLPNHTCDTSGQATCTYETPNVGLTSLTCNQNNTQIGKKVTIPTGPITAIGKACIFDSAVQRVCDTNEIEMIFN